MRRINIYPYNKRFPELDPDDMFPRRPWKYSFDWALQDSTDTVLFHLWPAYTGNGLWHYKLDGTIKAL